MGKGPSPLIRMNAEEPQQVRFRVTVAAKIRWSGKNGQLMELFAAAATAAVFPRVVRRILGSDREIPVKQRATTVTPREFPLPDDIAEELRHLHAMNKKMYSRSLAELLRERQLQDAMWGPRPPEILMADRRAAEAQRRAQEAYRRWIQDLSRYALEEERRARRPSPLRPFHPTTPIFPSALFHPPWEVPPRPARIPVPPLPTVATLRGVSVPYRSHMVVITMRAPQQSEPPERSSGVTSSFRTEATADERARIDRATTLFEVAEGRPMKDLCVICPSEYLPHDRVRRLRCGDEFHAVCVDLWLPNHPTCPLCKQNYLA